MSGRENQTIAIIGAGAVGCAVAHELSRLGYSTWVLEKGPRVGDGITSRNSGVIHAGLYYPPESLKSRSCILGNSLLYDWCATRGVPHRRCGKWILGSREDEADLKALHENSIKAGVPGLRWAESSELKSLTGVNAEVGLFSATTGIVDPFEYTRSLQTAAEALGATFTFNAEIRRIARSGDRAFLLETTRGEFEANVVVNAAGLYSDDIARLAGIDKYRIYPWRGDYFRVSNHSETAGLRQLIYPVKKKDAPGLGIHLTVGLDGSLRLGPDAEAVEGKEDFSPPDSVRLEEKKRLFHQAGVRYLPGLKLDDLSYDTCGIRPKLRAPGEKQERDFVLAEDLPGFINLVGIESPGLTASLALARYLTLILSGGA